MANLGQLLLWFHWRYCCRGWDVFWSKIIWPTDIWSTRNEMTWWPVNSRPKWLCMCRPIVRRSNVCRPNVCRPNVFSTNGVEPMSSGKCDEMFWNSVTLKSNGSFQHLFTAGAMTFNWLTFSRMPRSRMAFSRMPFCWMTLSRMALSRMALSIMAVRRMAFRRMAFRWMAFSRMTLNRTTLGRMTISRTDWHSVK